jgi:hypothetical protein
MFVASLSKLLYRVAFLLALAGSAILIGCYGQQLELALLEDVQIGLGIKLGLEALFLAESLALTARFLRLKKE